MTLFSDSFSDLRYQQGVVSFRFSSSLPESNGVTICIPIADFGRLVQLLSDELQPIQVTHGNWIMQQLALVDELKPVAMQTTSNPVLKKIASV